MYGNCIPNVQVRSASAILTRLIFQENPLASQATSGRMERGYKLMATINITLTETVEEDLESFFHFQLDTEANYLAAFTAKDPTDKAAYTKKYKTHLADPTIRMRTIKVDGIIVGSIAKFMMEDEAGITYWIDRAVWGHGIATRALTDFLTIEPARPIYGRVAFDNYGSQKVLKKCGFVKVRTEKGFANARQAEITEFIYKRPD